LQVLKEKEEIRNAVKNARLAGKTVGLVPTMGYLHEGHLSLVRKSASGCGITIVSIFVNPTQFGPMEDLSKYPRDLTRDLELLANTGADIVYFPKKDSMYRDGFSTWVNENDISKGLCGKTRRHHFRGVLTIVAKLFNIVQPDVAYFGQKDYQQAILIVNMAEELDFSVKIEICPIIREQDGLAMSSRNAYLNPSERKEAVIFNRTLRFVENEFISGKDSVEDLTMIGSVYFHDNSSTAKLEYLEIKDAETLENLKVIDEYPAVVLIAGKIGKTRLIDNLILKKSDQPVFTLMDEMEQTGKTVTDNFQG
jgi:pantoate--beta-alanine ligase